MEKRGDIDIGEIILWTLALLSLLVVILGIIVFRKGGENLIEKIINLFRYR
jgi:hypothetical protein